MRVPQYFKRPLAEACDCRVCADMLAPGARPILQAQPNAGIM